MKTRFSILVLVAILVLAVPAAAKGHEPVGLPIDLLAGSPTVFPAGQPFHISHGWALDPKLVHPIGLFDFELEVIGVPRDEDFVLRSFDRSDPDPLRLLWVHNFPDGKLAGTYTFTGRWFAPCEAAVDLGYLPGACLKRNAKIEAFTNSLTVTFTP
jgi:hypothetical protein